MKSQLLPALIIVSLFTVSCEKEDLAPKLRREAEEKIMGKWDVTKIIQQDYDPIPILKSTTERAGTTQDYYVFKSIGMVEINSGSSTQLELTFKVWNPYQVMIDGSTWWISEFTQTNLLLTRDWNDVDNNTRQVIKIFLKKK